MVPEALLEREATGLAPRGEGWFVLSARDAHWLTGHFGAYTRLEGDTRFPKLGFNIGVLAPCDPAQGRGRARDARSDEAYAGLTEDTSTDFDDRWLPGW